MNIKNTKWFTLVELIIVITILAVLWTIAFLSFNSYTKSSRDTQRTASLKNIEKWMEAYFIGNGFYPFPDNYTTITASGWEVLYYQGIIWENTTRTLQISKIPLDPLDQTPLYYTISADKKDFQVVSFLEWTPIAWLISESYAADLTNRKIKYIWQPFWLLLTSDNSLPSGVIDIENTPNTYNFHRFTSTSQSVVSGSGMVLKNVNPKSFFANMGNTPLQNIVIQTVTSDDFWNIYIWGNIRDTSSTIVDFAWKPISSIWTTHAMFLAKLNKYGTQEWIKLWLSQAVWPWNGPKIFYIIEKDGFLYLGWVYTSWTNSMDFKNQIMSQVWTVTSELFIMKMDTNGNQIWIKNLVWSWTETFTGLQSDGNFLYLAGTFTNNSTNSNGTLNFDGTQLFWKAASPAANGFFTKLTLDGDVIFTKTAWGGSAYNLTNMELIPWKWVLISWSVSNNNVNVNNIVDFWNNPHVPWFSGVTSDFIFLQHLDVNGNIVWTKNQLIQLLGTNSLTGLYYDKIKEKIYIAIKFWATNFQFTGNTFASKWNMDVYFAQLDLNGNVVWDKIHWWVWAEEVSTNSITTNIDGNIYFISTFTNDSSDTSNAVDFWGNPILGKTSSNTTNILMTQMNSNGDLISTQVASAILNPWIFSFKNNIFFTGRYQNSNTNTNNVVWFFDEIFYGLTWTSNYHVFLQKLK